MGKVTNNYLEIVNNQVLEKQKINFDKIGSETNVVNDIPRVLSALKDVVKSKRKLFFVKGGNNSYYNEAWNIYENTFPDLFLERMTNLETEIKKMHSELFSLVGGCSNSKIIIPGKKAMYIQDVLDAVEDALSLEFKGVTYSRECNYRNMRFEDFLLTSDFKKIQDKYEEDWKQRMNVIDNIIRDIGTYQEYAILNKEKECKIEYIQKVKVGIA